MAEILKRFYHGWASEMFNDVGFGESRRSLLKNESARALWFW
jgi:hypothetical protein